jgi:hypothetical protein
MNPTSRVEHRDHNRPSYRTAEIRAVGSVRHRDGAGEAIAESAKYIFLTSVQSKILASSAR